MKQVIYALQFRGQALPDPESPGVVNVRATAPTSTITTRVGDGGVRGAVHAPEPAAGPGAGGQATIEAEVRFTGEQTYHETGTITFGPNGHRLRFSSAAEGIIGPSADPERRAGAVVWRIDGGEGQFAGASGLITANFTVGSAGDLTVNQFGVIYV
jgi:hypothetical protein